MPYQRQVNAGSADAKPTAERLRADIDAGLTSDKVAFPDPAAAPLGTDEEAAGTPPPPEAVATAREEETTRPVPLAARVPATVIYGGIVAAIIVVAAIGVWLGR